MRRWAVIGCVALFLLLAAGWAIAAERGLRESISPLPYIARAPELNLTTQDGATLSLAQLRGDVVVITFICTRCPDQCPLLTAQMAGLQSRLGLDFGSRVFFLSITVDPEHDTPTVLNAYAHEFHANPAGWAFLTGGQAEILALAQRMGLAAQVAPNGSVEHTFLTSLVDRSGIIRVQYLETAFNPDEMLTDIQSLVR